MTDKHDIKKLISSYVDGECTPEEIELVESLILKSGEYQQYYKDLTRLSGNVLPQWKDEEPSPDVDLKIMNHISGAAQKEEGSTMKPKSNKKALIGGASFVIAIAVLAFTLQNYQQYNKHSISGKFKTSADDISDQFIPVKQQQELRQSSARLNEEAAAPTSIEFKGKENVGKKDVAAKLAKTEVQYEPYYLDSDYSVARSESTMNRARSTDGFQQSSYNPGRVSGYAAVAESDIAVGGIVAMKRHVSSPPVIYPPVDDRPAPQEAFNTEEYSSITENPFKTVTDNPLSTFSIDVDTGSYTNIRRFLNANQMPPVDSVRIEEMINYFSYDYPEPEGEEPFSITLDAAVCPWNTEHQLLRVGLKGKTFKEGAIPASNLVFLIDVSGSMNDRNKLPLLKQGFKMMVNQLSDNERVAIVVYAGAAGTVLESTPASDKQTILSAIDRLSAGGSTAGGAGIKLAYDIAQKHFIKGGNNRVILATDGDFNIGVSSTGALTRLIEEKREQGVFLTVLGFGTGNLKDGRMEQLANKGNGNYYYIDTQNEAKKVLVKELGSTLFTIAKDVKIQIEFNPAKIQAYRLIGYENRMLAKEDFNDDTKDAGELGAGHTVTALYEIVPVGKEFDSGNVDPLKYQAKSVVDSTELMTVKLRYKEPDADTSKLITRSIAEGEITSELTGDFKFAAAVAEFGLLLRKSKYSANASYDRVINSASEAKGDDSFGYRNEFINLVTSAKNMDISAEGTGSIQFKD